MTKRATLVCPVCGEEFLVATIFGHVGSVRCVTRLQFTLNGVLHDPVRGAAALELTRQLTKIIRTEN